MIFKNPPDLPSSAASPESSLDGGRKILPKSQNEFSLAEMESCGFGQLFSHNSDARLPSGQMRMFDKISHIDDKGGEYGKGVIEAQLSIHPDLWFFGCHFVGDPVMPGCLMLDALWQLMGFYLLWSGFEGRGRALGAKDVRFSGQVLPEHRQVVYRVDVRRVLSQSRHGATFGIGHGKVEVDGVLGCAATDLRTGIFVGMPASETVAQ